MPRYRKQGDTTGKKVLPSVTEVISDCTDSSAPLMQWSANCCKLWIQENCEQRTILDTRIKDGGEKDFYRVYMQQLDDMRFNFRKVSQKALDIGSEVHKLIEAYLLTIQKKSCITTAIMHGFIQDAKPEVNNAFNAFLKWKDEHNLKPIALEQTVYLNFGSYQVAGTLDLDCYLDNVRTIIDFKTSADFYWDSMGPQICAYASAYDPVPECGILRLDKSSGMPFYRSRTKYFERDFEIFENMVHIYMLRHPRIAKKARG